MDDNASRRSDLEEARRRPKLIQSYRRRIWKFFQSHRNTIFTSFLLLSSIVLLFGIFSQLQPPSTSTTPGIGTAIEYSTFIEQVKAGNVQAVTIRGNEINGLLEKSIKQTTTSTTSQNPQKKEVGPTSTTEANADYAAWNKYIANGNNSGWAGIGGNPPIDAGRSVYTRMPASGDQGLMPLLLANNVLVTTRPEARGADWGAMFWRAMPFIVVVVLLLIFFVSRNNNRSTKSVDERISHIGKSRARRFVRTREAPPVESKKPASDAKSGQLTKTSPARVSIDPGVTFADVAGIDEVRAELEEIVQFLRSPERFDRLGARIPRGALLVGPPGTGKTLLARAVAGEANVPFFSMSASEFVEMFVGVGASRVRDLFNQARQVAPCVIFLDEIDAVGRKRTMRVSGNDERDQTLNQLLVELDGFDGRKAVVVMAATNRVDILDKALLRPGRFDRRITVSAPDRVGREAILRVHTRQVPLHEDVSLERLSRLTVGMTGADLANLVNEAALAAARLDLDEVDHNCFEESLVRVQLGALRPIVMSEKEKRIIAIHESGHALVAHHLPEADSVNRVTILPRGQSLGVTQFVAEEDRYNYSREMLMARIAVGLGGRVAEELTFGPDQITTGAENDLQVVTDLARRMVTRWGMSEQLGVVFADQRSGEAFALNMRQIDPDAFPAQAYALTLDEYGNPVIPHRQQMFMMEAPVARSSGGVMMQALIDAEVQRILNEGHAIARALLTEHNHQLLCLADALMEYEQLDRAQFESLVQA